MRVYRSKVDGWLAAVLAIAIAASLYSSLAILAGPRAGFGMLFLTAGLGAALPLWILLGTRYTLGDEQLRIACGPFRWRVPLTDISGIQPTRNPLSSPALSLDRLRIDYGRGKSVMISPRDQAGFLREMEALRAGRLS